MGEKELQNQQGTSNLKLFIFQQLKRGLNPKKISKQYHLSETRISYHLSSLKKDGFVRKVGYGTWEIIKEFDPKQLQKSTKVTNNNILMGISKPDHVRGHAFQFTLKIPQLKNWDKREQIFTKQGIQFDPLMTGMGKIGQKIKFKGRKIWMLDRMIIVFEKASYMSETAEGSKNHAIFEFKKLINSLERFLGANFNINGKLLFKVSRQHFSLVKNALARQYDKEGKKLNVYDEGGFWLSIDNSFNLHELETLHPKTADQDNKKVQDFFNGIKQFEGFTPSFIVKGFAEQNELIGKVTQNQVVFDANMQSHIKAVQDLGSGVAKFNEKIDILIEKLKASHQRGEEN